jgi:hypothetical protein
MAYSITRSLSARTGAGIAIPRLYLSPAHNAFGAYRCPKLGAVERHQACSEKALISGNRRTVPIIET